MTVFHDRRTASYRELDGEAQQPPLWLNKTYSGGELPTRPDTPPKYPVDTTATATNMR